VSREHILLPPGYGTGMLVVAADTTAAKESMELNGEIIHIGFF